MLIRWKNKDKDKDKCEKASNQKQNSSSGTSKKKRKFGRDGEEEWNSEGKSGRGMSGTDSGEWYFFIIKTFVLFSKHEFYDE
ncbi:hypothetical protein JTB14_029269 [Gonioctena quinquepunctata]|nr:hypothetical protein JTB14_029269 [Gonioctena quinquepunctata]